ncbi:MAG: drug:proton antiporter [Hyphomicrobiales bacterium]|nr:MAG: drug:proton antiporter [Hyphomicrobiales bacterium]
MAADTSDPATIAPSGIADGNVSDPLVVFMPSGRRGHFAKGTTLLDGARSLGVYVESACGGRAICGRCQMVPVFGEFAKLGIESKANAVTGPTDVETTFRVEHGMREGRRLGCQTRIADDLVVDIPPDSEMHRQVVRKRAEARRFPLDPASRIYTVTVEEPDMHNPTGDLERLQEALERQHGVTVVDCTISVLNKLQKTLRSGQWAVTVAVHADDPHPATVTAIWPGKHDRALGLAVDVGSTTIACHVMDLNRGRTLASAGIMNPQIRFGEDLMSRVSYVMMNPGGDTAMSTAVREAIDALAAKVCTDISAAPADILEATFVANPVMLHLLLGLDPTELGGAPFALATSSARHFTASDIVLTFNADARIYTLPCIAGHVGADTAGVILSEKPHENDALTLVVDVGTNAEIVLGNRERLLACSSPTGPAFEGAELTSGQRAAPGAIERLRIDPETLEPRYKVIGCDLWSDEDGFETAIAATGVTGICGSGVIEAIGEMRLAGLLTPDGIVNGGIVDGSKAGTTERLRAEGRTFTYVVRQGPPEIRITQGDVRAIQLAKAALYAGCRLLMDKFGVDTVDRIRLAGAFGSHIDTAYAMLLGLIPDCPLDAVSSIGNAAGTGAQMALLDRRARREIETLVRRIEKIETAVEPEFQRHFIEAMAIPHKTAPTPNLAERFALPAGDAAQSETRPGRRRTRRRTTEQSD